MIRNPQSAIRNPKRMELIPLTSLSPAAYQLRGGSNAGLIVQDNRAVLVDTGLDKDTAKKILRHVESLKVKVAAVVITHAHADHFGGAATVRARLGVPVYAPALEGAIVAHPILEPLYLYSGAAPIVELRGKFILAEACPVDRLLEPGDTVIEGVPLMAIPAPGHAPNQMMIAGGGVCFVADAVFAPEIAAKHVIPFYADIDQALASLEALSGLDGQYAAFVPGHGAAVPSVTPWAAENTTRLKEIRATVQAVLGTADDAARILKLTADRLGLTIGNPVTYCLTQTTILACLSSLQKAGEAAVGVVDNRLVWQPA
jgi:glyoxylase-like metal-dependent hydrolase (beta-lactamase superfamily II)